MDNKKITLDDYSDLMTPDEVAELLRISKFAVYDMLKQGTISALHIGRMYRIPKINVIDFINRLSLAAGGREYASKDERRQKSDGYTK